MSIGTMGFYEGEASPIFCFFFDIIYLEPLLRDSIRATNRMKYRKGLFPERTFLLLLLSYTCSYMILGISLLISHHAKNLSFRKLFTSRAK